MDKIIEISPRVSDPQISPLPDNPNPKPSKRSHLCPFSGLKWLFQSVFHSQDSTLLSLMILLNGLLILYEAFFGWRVQSMVITSDALHGVIHLGSFVFALAAFLVARRGSSLTYTYGYERIETLSAFINAFFLCFLAGFAFGSRVHHLIEALGQLHAHHDDTSGQILSIDALKLSFNCLGMLVFLRYCGYNTGKTHYPDGTTSNFYTLFLHFSLDGLSNALSLILHLYKSLLPANTEILLFGLLFLLTMWLCRPVLRDTGQILLQAFPVRDEEYMGSALREISVVEGVLGVKEKRLWGLHGGYLVCSLKVFVRRDINREDSLRDIQQILRPKFRNVCVELVVDN